jgi:hypothetical protein
MLERRLLTYSQVRSNPARLLVIVAALLWACLSMSASPTRADSADSRRIPLAEAAAAILSSGSMPTEAGVEGSRPVTTSSATAAYAYDVAAVARADAHEFEAADASEVQVSGLSEGSAPPAVGGRSTSTTSSRSSIATNTPVPGDSVDLFKGPQQGQSTGPLNPADYPGKVGQFPDGRAYFTPDKAVAEQWAKQYGTEAIKVSIPRAQYDNMINFLKNVPDAGEFPYPGGAAGQIEVAIPRWLVHWLNKFPIGPA